MERKEIRIEDTWDLSGLFADQAQFDTAMEQAKQLLSEITQAQGHITESRESFRQFMDKQEALQRQCENLTVYAQMRADVEPEDPQVQQNLAKSVAFVNQAAAATTFVDQEFIEHQENRRSLSDGRRLRGLPVSDGRNIPHDSASSGRPDRAAAGTDERAVPEPAENLQGVCAGI